MYGYELKKIFSAQGEKVQLSYLYKTLKEMVGEGLLESHLKHGEHGPRRRQYCLTGQGKKELGKIFNEATELIHDFYEEYVSGLPPEVFSGRFHTMMEHAFGGRESVAFVISEPLTHLHRELLLGICQRSGAKRTYLIKPPAIQVHEEFPNLSVLDGAFDDLPLKDKSVDGMLVVDIQDATNLRTCCTEFRRILKGGGIVCGCAPFLGLRGQNDPLDLGEFMKRTKYTWTGKPYLEKEKIEQILNETFDYVDVAGLGFMTAFISGLKPKGT